MAWFHNGQKYVVHFGFVPLENNSGYGPENVGPKVTTVHGRCTFPGHALWSGIFSVDVFCRRYRAYYHVGTSVRSHSANPTRPNFTNVNVLGLHVTCGRGSILLRGQCNTLRYFRFCGWPHVCQMPIIGAADWGQRSMTPRMSTIASFNFRPIRYCWSDNSQEAHNRSQQSIELDAFLIAYNRYIC